MSTQTQCFVAAAVFVLLLTLIVSASEVGEKRAQEQIAIECVKSGGEWIVSGWPPHGCIRRKSQ